MPFRVSMTSSPAAYNLRVQATRGCPRVGTLHTRRSPMKTLLGALLTLTIAIVSIQAQDQKQDQKKDEKSAVGALPPHPLDDAFKNVKSERQIYDKLLNNKLYKEAVKAALKAKQDQEDRFKKNPKLRDATPEQAARVKFLEVLKNEM